MHENQLLQIIWPNTFKGKPWKVNVPPEDAGSENASVADLFRRQEVILQGIVNVQRVQHLHSLALSTLVDKVAAVRGKDGSMPEDLAKELKAAQRATLLASDPDLKQLPFKSIASIADFFTHEDRVQKLASYLCTYVPYDKTQYAGNLCRALIHPQLMDIAYWAGRSKRGYVEIETYLVRSFDYTRFNFSIYMSCEPDHDRVKYGSFLPAVFEVFIERVAFASHNMAHFYESCDFDFKLFNDKMNTALKETKVRPGKGAVPVGKIVCRSKAEGEESRPQKSQEQLPAPHPTVTVDFGPHTQNPGPSGARPTSGRHAVAANLCGKMGWPLMDAETFLRRARISLGFRKDPLRENEDLQAELDALHDNPHRGKLEATLKNLEFLKAIKP